MVWRPTRNSHARLLVKRIHIRNFKSIKNVTLDLYPGVNVLVGGNASGKTNILEAIAFMRKALVDAAERIPYRPHAPTYWSPLDIIYGRDPAQTIMLGLELTYYWKPDDKATDGWASIDITFSFEMAYDKVSDTLEPVRYHLRIGNERYYTRLEIQMNRIEMTTSIEAFRKMKEIFKSSRLHVYLEKQLSKIIEKAKVVGEEVRFVFELEESLPSPMLLTRQPLAVRGKSRVERDYYIGVEELLLSGTFITIPFIVGFTRISRPRGLLLKGGALVRFLSRNMSPTSIIKFLIPDVLSKVIMVRHPDIGAIGEPARFTGSDKLDERARNLAEVLLSLQGRLGRFPERVERALRRLFPAISLRVETRFGRVVVVGEENGVELPPPCLPDGLVKLVALMLAADLEPSILLVDEIENSMHARLLEYVIDEFNNLGVPVLVATHSPVVVDLVEPERVLIVRRDPEKGTIVERIRDVEELRQKLIEEGIALSDYILYGETY